MKYIGTKLVEATPMTRGEYNTFRGWEIPKNENGKDPGYLVRYSDTYVSWSPKDVFDSAHLVVNNNENLPSEASISEKMVEEFIDSTNTMTLGDRTTVVRCVLKNGYEIVESSSCVDPKNYSEKMGHEICMNEIKNKIWELLGFLLQTAWHGIK